MLLGADLYGVNSFRKSKYHNNKVVINGVKFDSQSEYIRFLELTGLEKDGTIKNLQRQVRFEIIPKTETERAAYYVADFVYEKDGQKVIEDRKSAITKKLHDYILKRKLIKWRYPDYKFVETY